MPERYICKLSPELRKKANEELNEPSNVEEIHAAIDKLKVGYSEEKCGKLIREDDYFFLRFLRAKKYNTEKALKCLENYHLVRSDMTEIFDKVKNPVLIDKSIFEGDILYMLPGKSKVGAAVMMYRPGLLDKDVKIPDLTAYSLMCIEKMLEDEAVQICGLETIKDFENFNMSLMLKLPMSEMKKMNKLWMDAMPLRFKAQHMIHQGKIYDAILAVIKHFMKQKMLDRIRYHGTNYASLHEHVDPAILPPYIGGTGLSPEEESKRWMETLREDWAHDTEL